MHTRTVNPLHFEDLEPHRFEDLIRQLAYDFREWKMIEATGRCGSDDGIDIRAIERVTEIIEIIDDQLETQSISEREWIIQCKREQSIGPAKVRKIISESFPEGRQNTYAFILAAACDFSKKSRDAFRSEMSALGIHEFYLWGKADLEDMLFRPQNDHLLFAYFNISLQVRKKSLKSSLRTRLATKRKVTDIIGGVNETVYKPVLLKRADAQDYPMIEDQSKFIARPDWKYFICLGQLYPDHLLFIEREHYAYLASDNEAWDALTGDQNNIANRSYHPIHGLDDTQRDQIDNDGWKKWQDLPEENRAMAYRRGFIHLDRIIAIDADGDYFHPGPHIYVEVNEPEGFFDGYSDLLEIGSGYSRREFSLNHDKRVKYFK